MLLNLADERPLDHLPAADVVRARDRVEQGDEAAGDVRPERLTADELGSARWRSAHWDPRLNHLNQPVKHYASRAPLVGAAGSLPVGMILDGSHDAEAVSG